MSIPVIDRFRDEHRFLSNFWPSPAAYVGITYPTAEHAYQAAKTENPDIREAIGQEPKPFAAKTHGSTLDLRQGWTEGLDVIAMSEVLASKFRLNPELGEQLVATGSVILIEGNHWHDNNWGSCTCEAPDCAAPGRNKLGHALMALRAALAAEQESLRPFAPYRIVRSAEELKGLACGSVVCSAWTPSEAVQRTSADDAWCAAGTDEELSSQQLWGYFTEPFIGMRPDDEREVWVLWDGALQLERPPRPAGTPDWAFTADSPGRRVTNLHQDREGAIKDFEEYAATSLGKSFPGRLWHRAEGKRVFYRAAAAEGQAVPNPSVS